MVESLLINRSEANAGKKKTGAGQNRTGSVTLQDATGQVKPHYFKTLGTNTVRYRTLPVLPYIFWYAPASKPLVGG